MQLNVVAYHTDKSVTVSIPDSFLSVLGEGRKVMRFTSIKDASRYFSKLARKEKRAKLNDRFGQALLDENLMPKHTPSGKLRMADKTKRYSTFALK